MYSARRVVRRNPATDLPQVKRKCESPLRDDRAKMRLDADVDDRAVAPPSLARACKILIFGIHRG